MKEILQTGQIIIIPLTALIITQLIKVAIDLERKKFKKFKLQYLNYYGGMPSAHSALFAALATTSLLVYNWYSFQFAVSLILYLVIVRDAMGIRWHLGNHGFILKQLIHEHVKDHDVIKHGKIVTRLGHKPIEVFVGTMCGIIFSIIGLTILN